MWNKNSTFRETVKDTTLGLIISIFILFAVFGFPVLFSYNDEKEAKPTPLPLPTPAPTTTPTLSPEEVAQENEFWQWEAMEFAKENLPQNYTELVYEYYELLEYCLELESDVQDLQDDLQNLQYELEAE